MILDYDKQSKQWGNIVSKIGKTMSKKFSSGFTTEVKDIFSMLNPDQKLMDALSDNFSNGIKDMPQAIQDYVAALPEARQKTILVSEAMQEMQKNSSVAGKALSSLKNIGLTALSTLGTMAISMAASWAIGEIIRGVHDWIHADEIAIEKGKEATSAIEDQYDAYKKMKDVIKDIGKTASGKDDLSGSEESISEIAKKYDELHDGVNDLTNANKNLSTEKYQEYLDVCNQIAEQFPTLVSGYDDQGNAILNLGNTASQAEASLLRMYEASKLAANVSMGEDLQESYKGFIKQIEQYENDNEYLQDQISVLNDNLKDTSVSSSDIKIDGDIITLSNQTGLKREQLQEIVSQYGLFLESIGDSLDGEYQFYVDGLNSKSDSEIKEIIDLFTNKVAAYSKAANDTIQAEVLSNTQQMSANDLYIKDQKKSIIGIINKYLQTSDIFEDVNSDLQNAILSNLDDLDLSLISDKYSGNIIPYIYGELIEPISELTPDIQDALSKAFNIIPDNKTTAEYSNEIQGILLDAFGGNTQLTNEWYNKLGFGNLFADFIEKRQKIFDEFGGQPALSTEDQLSIFGLSISDLEIASDLVEDNVYATLDELFSAVEKYKAKNSSNTKTGTLADIFNDGQLKEKADSYSSTLSTITDALEKYRTEGKLTAEEQTKLMEELKTDKINPEDLQQLGTEQLTKYIEALRETADTADLSEDAMAGLDKYIQSLILSYGDLGASAEQAWNEVRNIIVNGEAGGVDWRIQEDQFKQIKEDFETKYGNGLNSQIIWQMAIDGAFATGQMDDWYAEYNDRVVNWEIEITNKNRLEELENNIAERDTRRSTLEQLNDIRKNGYDDSLLRRSNDISQEDYWETVREYGADSKEAAAAKKSMRDAAQAFADNSQEDYYREILQIDQDNIVDREEAWRIAKDNYNKNKSSQNSKALLEAEKEYYSAIAQRTEDEIAQQEAPINKLSNELTQLQNDATNAQNAITQLENDGKPATKDQYQTLIDNASNQLANLQEQKSIWEAIAEIRKGGDPQSYISALQAITEADNQMIQLKADTDEWQQMIDFGLDQKKLTDSLTGLQSEAEKLQGALSLKDARGVQKVAKDYDGLIKNSREQILNLREQNNLLQEQLSTLEPTDAEYWNIQSQINSNNSSIRSAIQSQLEWNEAIKALPLEAMTQFNEYTKALSSFNPSDNYSEIVSGKSGADKLWDQGWVGKDDFTTYAKMLGKNGDSREEYVLNYEANAQKMSRYLTEDASGLYNFLDDAVEKTTELGKEWVKFGKDGYTFDIDNLADFADEMGMTTELAGHFFMALRDAGMNVDLKMIGDGFAEQFSQVDFEANNAAQQVQNLVNEMETLAASDIDITGSVENAASALEQLSDQGVDVSMMLEQLNELGNMNGFHINDDFTVTFTQLASAYDKIAQYQDLSLHANISVEGQDQLSSIESELAGLDQETLISIGFTASDGDTITAQDIRDQIGTVQIPIEYQNASTGEASADVVQTIDGDNSPFKEKVDEAVSYAESKTAVSRVDGDISPIKSKIASVDGTNIKVGADVSGVSSAISSALSGIHHITVSASVVGLPKALGTAHAQGTATYDMWTGYRHSIGAYANGSSQDWSLKHNESALVNEVGMESIVRDGRWIPIPGGAHVEQLKRGDIIFNAAQTQELIKNGRVISNGGHGRVALATGTAYNMMPAHSINQSVTGGSGVIRRPTSSTSSSTSSPASSSAQKANTAATEKNTKSTKEETTALDKFKEWLEKFVDWVDNRIDTLTTKIDRFQKAAENAVGYTNKNGQIKNAMNTLSDMKTYQKAKITLNSNGEATKASGGKKGTLLYDTMRGAVRYQKQADKVANQAIKDGIVSKKQMAKIKKLVAKGTININAYDEGIREVISSYEDWYKKSQELITSTYDLKQQYKELEQTKLDNITEQYESIIGYAEAVSNTSAALVSLSEAKGEAINSSNNKSLYQSQINQQTKVSNNIQSELSAYAKEMKNAAQIFGKNSNEYRSAQTAYAEMQKAYAESETARLALEKVKFELDITPIQNAIDKLKDFGSRLSDFVGLKQARGTIYGNSSSTIKESDYQQQINNNNDLLEKYMSERQKYLQEIDKMNYLADNQNYKDLKDKIDDTDSAMRKLIIDKEGLKDSIVELRWKKFSEFEESLNTAISDYEHLKGLMDETSFFDNNGKGWNLTDSGYASIVLTSTQMDAAKQQIVDYRKALEQLQKQYKGNLISLEEFNKSSNEYVGIIQQSVNDVEKYKDALISLYKTQINNENTALQQNITLRKQALQSKKSYYDYDKTIKQKNKDLNHLKAQAAALQGVNNDAAKAQLAKINAQIKEAEEDLTDTKLEHEYEVHISGYDKLSDDADDALQKTLDALESNADLQEQVVQEMLSKVEGHYSEAYNRIQKIILDTGTVVSDVADNTINSLSKIINTVDKAKTETLEYKTSSQANDINTNNISTTTNSSGKTIASTIESTAFNKNTDAEDAATKNKNEAIASATKNKNEAIARATKNKNEAIASAQNQITNLQSALKQQQQDLAEWQKQVKAKQTELTKLQANLTDAQDRLAYWKQLNSVKSTTKRKEKVIYWTNLVKERTSQVSSANTALKNAQSQLTKIQNNINSYQNQIATQQAVLVKLKGYRTGTSGVKKDELNWLHEGEVVYRRDDGAILRPFGAGDMVFTNKQSENLWKMSQIDPEKIKSMIYDVDMSKLIVPGVVDRMPDVSKNEVNQNIQFDSLFRIDGNVDANVMDRLEELGKALVKNRNFQKNLTDIVTKDFKREAGKAGYRGH